MELLAFRLASIMDRPVIDQTGIKGDYDFKLAYTQELPPNISPNALLNGQPIDLFGPRFSRRCASSQGFASTPTKARLKSWSSIRSTSSAPTNARFRTPRD